MLSPRKKLFIAEYLIDFDGSRAAKAAGYSGNKNVLAVRANKLLKEPEVRRQVERFRGEQLDEKRLERKEVLRKVADNLHRDLCDLCDENGIVYDNLRKIPKRAHAFIDGLEVIQEFGKDEDGNRAIIGQRIKIKLSPSAQVQDMAMKHAGLYAAEKKDVNVRQVSVDITELCTRVGVEDDPVEQAILDVGKE